MSCGKGVDGAKYDHGEFQKYFDSFDNYSKQEGKDVSAVLGTIEINFDEISTEEVGGTCKRNFMGHGKIAIDAESWKKMSEDSRRYSFFTS